MRASSLFCLTLAANVFAGCQRDATEPSHDLALLHATGAGLRVKAKPNEAVTVSERVHFHPRTGKVTTSDAVAGMGNVHTRFSSVGEACLDFTFADDLFGEGDSFQITVDGSEAGGFFNTGGEIQSTRTLCWTPEFAPEIVALFLDGKAKLKFSMETGSVALSSVTLTISGPRR
jgi:hypothetical protein